MPPQNPLLILNPTAGGGKAHAALKALAPHLPVRLTERPGHAVRLALQAVEDGHDLVIGGGGDGTFHEIANGLMRSSNPPPLAIVPAGTGNDFARSLGIPTHLPDALAVALTNGVPQPIDVGLCGDRYFLNGGGAGFDAQVACAVNGAPPLLRRGPLPFVLYALRELTRLRSHPIAVRLDGGQPIH